MLLEFSYPWWFPFFLTFGWWLPGLIGLVVTVGCARLLQSRGAIAPMLGWGTLANVIMHLAFAAGVSVMSWLGFLDADWREPEVEFLLLA